MSFKTTQIPACPSSNAMGATNGCEKASTNKLATVVTVAATTTNATLVGTKPVSNGRIDLSLDNKSTCW